MLCENGSVMTWGSNHHQCLAHRRLKAGVYIPDPSPTVVPKAVSLSVCNSTAAIVDTSGHLWVWGKAWDRKFASGTPIRLAMNGKKNGNCSSSSSSSSSSRVVVVVVVVVLLLLLLLLFVCLFVC